MNNNQKAINIDDFSCLLQQIGSLMSLTLPGIKYIYETYTHCIIDYYEQDVTEKSIEIRFDTEEVTVTCTFNPKGNCNMIYLFSDKRQTIENLIDYLKKRYEYDFIKNRWTVSGYYVCIKKTSYPPYDIYVLFYS
ncbi:hypothetical protein [Parabacteroides bouchesdurhonensis]|uniref:hypothetical protein n=1 Tax=Parabacteroides bouchesdurhonensis TaxID=1936995 RepID=UPI000E512511|nr:hypothetical protein [Parabacteroides bouchesdurhonensis]RHJ92099.1 hypothetical protein DW095_08585 [Bacteroides sp. AM07-16]